MNLMTANQMKTLLDQVKTNFYSNIEQTPSWGRFHKSLKLGVFHRDSSICLRSMPTPNFYTTKSFSKVGPMAQKLGVGHKALRRSFAPYAKILPLKKLLKSWA